MVQALRGTLECEEACHGDTTGRDEGSLATAGPSPEAWAMRTLYPAARSSDLIR